MKPLFKGFTLQEKSNLLLAFSLCTKPIKQEKKVHKRRRNEFKDSSAALILQLDLWDLPLTNETTAELVFALAKLQIENTKFITFPLRDHISENLESYC